MAQEPDRMTGAAPGMPVPGTPAPGTTGTETPTEIARDIRHTRAEMTETIDALSARFEPSYLKEQAQEAIADTARSAGTSMIDTLKENPLPAAIAAMSVAWLFANRSSGTAPPRKASAYPTPTSYGGRGAATYGTASSASGSSDPNLADRAGALAGDARDEASKLADDARRKASGLADTVSETASDLGQQATDAAHRAESWLEGQMNRNPLGVGAVALAAGALVGLALPESQVEMRLMGESAGQIVGKAKAAAGDTLDHVKEVAGRVADEAKDKAADLADEAKKDAKDLAETARSDAKDVASDAKDRASGAAASLKDDVPKVGTA